MRPFRYVPEGPTFYTTFKVKENLHMIGKIAGLRGKKLADRVEEVLDTVNLGSKAQAGIGLSPGECYRGWPFRIACSVPRNERPGR